MLKFNFDSNTTFALKLIAKNAQKFNKRVFFVGGMVRDRILDLPISDIDLLILGNAIEFARVLPEVFEIHSIHEDFCTVKVACNNVLFDIASSRFEKYPFSGCLPVLGGVGVDLDIDVKRRDFPISTHNKEN